MPNPLVILRSATLSLRHTLRRTSFFPRIFTFFIGRPFFLFF
jgi:hypothetical protein